MCCSTRRPVSSEAHDILDPYRDINERALRSLRETSIEERLKLSQEIGIYDEQGNVTPRYGGDGTKPARATEVGGESSEPVGEEGAA
jgi:hypothetical protein